MRSMGMGFYAMDNHLQRLQDAFVTVIETINYQDAGLISDIVRP